MLPKIELAPGVFAVTTRHVDGKSALVIGSADVLLMDAGMDLEEGEALRNVAAGLGAPVTSVLYSHGHWDHVRGGPAFAGRPIACHREAQQMALEHLGMAEDRMPDVDGGLAGTPNRLIDSVEELSLGDRSVEILTTPGHAPGCVSLFLREEAVLFGSDTTVTNIPPVFRDGSSTALENTLRTLADMNVQTLVPGHGPILQGRGTVRAWLEWLADYIAKARRHVTDQLVTGADAESMISGAKFEEFVEKKLSPDDHRNRWRHEQTIRHLLAEQDIAGR